MARQKCSTIKQDGTRCKSFSASERGLCSSHDPEMRSARREGSRKGGAARSNTRRAIKAWAAFGKEVDTNDVPMILYSCMEAVRTGAMTPGQASAIATLAKTAGQITNDTEMMKRIEALEEAAGVISPDIRKVG